jgi:putative membrane protein
MTMHWLFLSHSPLRERAFDAAAGGSTFPYPDPATFSWLDWDFHWDVGIGVIILAVLYFWGITRARVKYNLSDTPAPRWKIACFIVAHLFFLGATNGPLHHLSDYYLLSAHMVQHLIFIQIYAPLLLLSIPGWLLKPLFRPNWIRKTAYWVTRPWISFLLANVVLAFWHLPGPHDAAMHNHDIHVLQHLTFLVAAVILWWPAISPVPDVLPEPPPLFKMIYLFTTTLPMCIIGILIALAETPVYSFYANAPRVFDISPYHDQVLGGLIMWIPGSMLPWVAITIIFMRWFYYTKEDGVLETPRHAKDPVPARASALKAHRS